jgi:hypothetical protein
MPAHFGLCSKRGNYQRKYTLAGDGHPRRGAKLTRNGKPCKGLVDMLHNHAQKSKGEKLKVFQQGKTFGRG